MKPARNTICLWYDHDAEDAARFYASTFPDTTVDAVHHAPGDFPSGKKGDVLTVQFTVMGIPCLGLNGGPAFKQSEAFSFQVATVDQAETDRYWNAIVGNGGDHRSGSRRRQARVRCDDADGEDRHRDDRGGAARLKLHVSGHGRPALRWRVRSSHGLRATPAFRRTFNAPRCSRSMAYCAILRPSARPVSLSKR
jgi:predicted 3-demethylubiquinone-9 3-methyltransferase (glyoxalase superfamily)